MATMSAGWARPVPGLSTAAVPAAIPQRKASSAPPPRMKPCTIPATKQSPAPVALRTGTGSPETSITVGKSLNLFGYRTPLVFTHDKNGEVTTISGQVEWRFGNFVLRLGASQSTADSLAPSGEIRHTWSPR